MSAQRLLYITQDELQVCSFRKGAISLERTFAHGDEGFGAFSSYLSESLAERCLMVVDVIEEEFFPDTIPALSYRDRESLIDRRVQKRFPRSQYRIGQSQGKSKAGNGETEVLYSAVSNPELLDSWLKVIEAQKIALAGIYSVPLLASTVLRKVCKPARHALLLSTHQGDKLRQSYFVDGKLKSSRLSKSPPSDEGDFPSLLAEEIQRSRRYLERGRLLSFNDELHIYIVADADLARRIAATDLLTSGTRLHAIDPATAGAKVGLNSKVDETRIEHVYLALASRKRLKPCYSVSGETRYNSLRRIRQLATACTIVLAVLCSAVSGVYLTDAFQLRSTTKTVREQIARLEDTYRRENEKFQPLKADSQEMKIVVDTGDFILGNSVPVSFVMQQLSLVLGEFPDMHIDELAWNTSAAADEANQPRRLRPGEAPPPLPIPRVTEISADVTGQILPFDGDLKNAFERIRMLAAALETRTQFARVQATEFPINDSPAVPLSADVDRSGDDRPARFRLRLIMEVNGGQDAG